MFRASCVVAASGLAHGLTLQRQPVASDGLEEYEPVGLHKDGNRQGSYAPSDDDGPALHSAAWYKQRCEEINEHCQFLSDHRLNAAKEDRQFLKDECEKQKRILADKKDTHSSEKTHVSAEEKQVAAAKMKVSEAKEVVDTYAQCPPELASAKTELARLQAIHNKVTADIDAECKIEKVVHEKEKCVDKLRAAEKVLAEHEGDHIMEKSDLNHEKTHVQPAADAVPPQEEKVIEVCARWQDLINPSTDGIQATCKSQRDGLMGGLDSDLAALDDECARQKRKLDRKEDLHMDEKAEHAAQEEDVAASRIQVQKAEVAVKENAHCPPELAEAKGDLARLEAIPNKSPADIDAECDLHQRILEAQQCVDVLRAAEAVLSHKDGVHSGEKSELHNEAADVSQAKAALPPQEAVVAQVCGDWEAAKAKWAVASQACKA